MRLALRNRLALRKRFALRRRFVLGNRFVLRNRLALRKRYSLRRYSGHAPTIVGTCPFVNRAGQSQGGTHGADRDSHPRRARAAV
jgi:hypothetical protein